VIVSLLCIAFTRIMPSQPQKTIIMTFLTDRDFLNSTDCPFGAQFKMIEPGFICCDNPAQEGLFPSFTIYQQPVPMMGWKGTSYKLPGPSIKYLGL
jgi:hypothetical protein